MDDNKFLGMDHIFWLISLLFSVSVALDISSVLAKAFY